MNTLLFAFADEASAAANNALNTAASALPEALRISGIALVAIFIVMGLFAAMIFLLTRAFPDSEETDS